MQLKAGTVLQGGKYRIEKILGQGGFGITYLASIEIESVQSLGRIKMEVPVTIKEFFMKDHCNRDATTSQVSISSQGAKELVESFKRKFIKEAQTIAALEHPNIVKIHDVFEENGTAYYAMEYIEGGSLSDYVAQHGPMSEQLALRYIGQIAKALEYLHSRQMNHLDVKPGNILLNASNDVILIDFGLSKHYDEEGHATSTTPVGISHGYAPMEQYRNGGVSEFSPATDIYSLGATLYKLLTGQTPPDAGSVFDGGLPSLPAGISAATCNAVSQAMQPKRKDRPQSISAFLSLLDIEQPDAEDLEATVITSPSSFTKNDSDIPHNPSQSGKSELRDEPADKESGIWTAFKTHWKNRPMVTNIVLVLACLAYLLPALLAAVDLAEDWLSFVSFSSNLCFVVGIVMFLFNKRQGIIPIVICVFWYTVTAGVVFVFIFVIIPAAVVVGSLFIRKNGISTWEYMKNQSRLSSHSARAKNNIDIPHNPSQSGKSELRDEPADKESGIWTAFKTHWKNRSMVTNTVLLLACLVAMLLDFKALINLFEDQDVWAAGMFMTSLCFTVGTSMLLCNKWQGMIPFGISIMFFLVLLFPLGLLIVLATAVFVGSLFIRKNGISTWEYMKNQSRLSSHKEIEK